MKRLGAVAVALVMYALVIAAPVRGQDSTTVPLGAHLRVRVDSVSPWQRGTFAGVSSDTLLLRRARSALVIGFSLSSLAEIDIRERDANAQRSNAILGLVLGAAAGVLVVHLDVRQCEIRHPRTDGPPCAIGYGLIPIAALAGAGVGAVVGRIWPAYRWRPVTVIAPPGS